MTLIFRSSCLCLLSAWITGVCHSTQFMQFLGFRVVGQVFCLLSYIPTMGLIFSVSLLRQVRTDGQDYLMFLTAKWLKSQTTSIHVLEQTTGKFLYKFVMVLGSFRHSSIWPRINFIKEEALFRYWCQDHTQEHSQDEVPNFLVIGL